MTQFLHFTICSKNYLAYALTLGRSLVEADPDARFVIFLADSALDEDEARLVEFQTIPVAELALPEMRDMAIRYSVMEFNTAIKPACFIHAFTALGAKNAIYLDPDILVLKELSHVKEALSDGAALVLTPHSLYPLDDGGDPDDLRLLRTGVYNLGFAAFAHTPAAVSFLEWWRARLAADCRVALPDGLFVDQKWMDLAPAYLDHTVILRHPGYNAAYWNLLRRPIAKGGRELQAGGETLHFFHFSGVDPSDPTLFSKHQSRFEVADIGEPLQELLATYLSEVTANGQGYWSTKPYAFAEAPDGGVLTDLMRSVYRRAFPDRGLETLSAQAIVDLCNAPSSEISDHLGAVTNLTYEIWASRPDLRSAFDLTTRRGVADFNAWLLTSGQREHALEAVFLAHISANPPSADRTSPRNPRSRRLIIAAAQYRWLARPFWRLLPGSARLRLKRRLNRALDIAKPHSEDHGAPVFRETLAHSVCVYGYLATESGVGEAGRRTYRALKAVGCPVTARPISTRGVFQDEVRFEAPFESGPSSADAHLFHMNADQTVGAEERFPAGTFSTERIRIGYWAWELERFPEEWLPAFDLVDEVWTPSAFTRDAVQAATEKPVLVMPHPVPFRTVANEADRARGRLQFALPPNRTLFLAMFDFNSYIERKNPYAALEAFTRAAERRPGLGLVVKCHGSPRHDAQRYALLELLRERDDVWVIDRVLSSEEMDGLYNACDGLLSLHRSEGFGLTIAEAMSRGLPVVATGYSGSNDFFDADVGMPVSFSMVAVPVGAYPHAQGSTWAEPCPENAADALVRLADDEALRLRLGAAARDRVLQTLSFETVGRQMAERIRHLRRQRESAQEKMVM